VSTQEETLQVSVLPYRCSICPPLVTRQCQSCNQVPATHGQPVRFAVHRQPLCWDFMYQSRIVLSVGVSVWYTVRNPRCTVTTDSVLANSKIENAFLLPDHAMFRHDCSLAVKLASTPRHLVKKKKKTLPIDMLLSAVFFGCWSAEIVSSGGTYELFPCIYRYSHITQLLLSIFILLIYNL